MKPLSPITYLINNLKRVLPSFICMVFSVFLIYFASLVISSSTYVMKLNNLNMVKTVTLVTANSKSPIPDKVINEIKQDSNVKDVIPIISTNGYLEYDSPFGGSNFNSYNVYNKDISRLLNMFQLKLVEGKLPSSDKDEIIIPLRYAKQIGIKVGQNMVSNFDKNMVIDKKYKVCGFIDGPVNLALTSNKSDTPKETALKYSLMFSVKNGSPGKINSSITALGGSNLLISDYKVTKASINDYIKSLDALIFIFDLVIIIVLIISLSNLNYIVFMSRKNEFSILYAVGYKTKHIYLKLLKENFLLNFLSFIIGIILVVIVTELLNITVWIPKGQYVQSFNIHYIIITFLVPLSVSVASILSYFRELKYINHII